LDEALDEIECNARLQATLINDILDLVKSANGMLRIERQAVDVNSVVKAAHAVVEPAASAKGVRLACKTAPHPVHVTGDPIRLQQVVWNLLTNAVKFTPGGGRVNAEVAADAEHVRLRVSDSGCGISPEFLPRAFGRFEQGTSMGGGGGGGGRRRAAGAGLGLAIVRRLAEAHGGSVQASSPGEGRGATFTVLLPRSAAPA
jgi:two-component system CheB/CheR fusion protein